MRKKEFLLVVYSSQESVRTRRGRRSALRVHQVQRVRCLHGIALVLKDIMILTVMATVRASALSVARAFTKTRSASPPACHVPWVHLPLRELQSVKSAQQENTWESIQMRRFVRIAPQTVPRKKVQLT